MSDQDPAPNSGSTAAHSFSSELYLAVEYAGSPLHTVCIPTQAQCSIQCATITKLHIKFFGLSSRPTLSDLQCNKLQDLALETSERLSCPDMLNDSRQILRHVNLAARNCCAATYKSIASIPQLETSIIRVWAVSATQANAMQQVQARSAQMVLHYKLSNVLTKVSIVGLRLHKLTLWKVTDRHIAQLQQLPCLNSLVIAHSPYFTGSSLQTLPRVTSLTLNLCKGVTAEGMRHMLATAIPAVEELVFESTAEKEELDHLENTNCCKTVHINKPAYKQEWVLEADLLSSLSVGRCILVFDFSSVVCPSYQELLCLQLQQVPLVDRYQSICTALLPPICDSADDKDRSEGAAIKNLCARLLEIKLQTSQQRKLHFVEKGNI